MHFNDSILQTKQQQTKKYKNLRHKQKPKCNHKDMALWGLVRTNEERQTDSTDTQFFLKTTK